MERDDSSQDIESVVDEILETAADLDRSDVSTHLAEFTGRYTSAFSPADIALHVRSLDRLNTENPVSVIFVRNRARNSDPSGNRSGLTCTVISYDYPGVFSLVSGLLAAGGFNVESGDIFTCESSGSSKSSGSSSQSSGSSTDSESRQIRKLQRSRHYRVRRRRRISENIPRRRIIDRFTGSVTTGLSDAEWESEVTRRLETVVSLLEHENDGSAARQKVNQWVAGRLKEEDTETLQYLYPVHLTIDTSKKSQTGLTVVSEDTPFFLYALSTALSLTGVSIEQVEIRTISGRIEDRFSLTGPDREKITDPDLIDRVKMSVLLTKQFTYFLGEAPDPYAALLRFESLVEDVVTIPDQARWVDLLSNPKVMSDLAKILGTSDYLWEDFIRRQYENLLPMLGPHINSRGFGIPVEELEDALSAEMKSAADRDDQKRILNEFKDRENFRMDLDHILNKSIDFRNLSFRLTQLAEVVVREAFRTTYDYLSKRYGTPQTVAGFETRYGIFGLGKLGGMALGYASDIELLFVYADAGETLGPEPIRNQEFFERLVREATGMIETKREGIFQVDLRLRPYGSAGSPAAGLERFCTYYGKGGEAHAFERLALVRLRTIGGDREFGALVERLRDEMVYDPESIDLPSLREIRRKQLDEKTRSGILNAKFSTGALVDLEYAVQILQVEHGAHRNSLRTPSIHTALEALVEIGVMDNEESEQLAEAYRFLRQLINALRILRGSAKDLYLPAVGSDEYLHLARRMGYDWEGGLDPSAKLHYEFETRTAMVRLFVEKYFGRKALPAAGAGNIIDLVLSTELDDEDAEAIIERYAFKNSTRARVNIAGLASRDREAFAKLAVLAIDTAVRQPDPDMCLNNWDRFVDILSDPSEHFRQLLAQPRRLDILLGIFAGSQFLADTLIRNPEFFDWATRPDVLRSTRTKEEILAVLKELSESATDHRRWLDDIRIRRRLEVLRIGTRDICLGVPIETVGTELSALADAFAEVCLGRVWDTTDTAMTDLRSRFCVMAFGKLGGAELNYSSDIDIFGIFDDDGLDEEQCHAFGKVMERLRADLSVHTPEGHGYRVDLRLRPWGRAGVLVQSLTGVMKYYHEAAAPWEIQALLKLRPIAGNIGLGERLCTETAPLLRTGFEREQIITTITGNRGQAVRQNRAIRRGGIDIKTSPGCIRDIEFLVQGLQLLHAPQTEGDLSGNTLVALSELARWGIMDPGTTERLRDGYSFLRRVEHLLQLFEDRQIHHLPEDPDQLTALAKRAAGPEADGESFMKSVGEIRENVARSYERYFEVSLFESL